ncbi:hypothetical protein [Halomicrococcus gelatinilyticus]|uniref:hypothetical protein n=1 Tax=Halomicrococcus gelatinilyticus TaxID=1702103 RepID=UPI002E0DC2E9
MSDDGSRADRLRRRREQQRDQQPTPSTPSEQSETSDPSKLSETSEQPGSSGTSGNDGTTSVKDDRVGTYMYLPEDQRAELDFAYKELSLAYEREFGDDLEKNRHFYPLLVQAGLEHLDDLDGDAIRERLESFEP